MRLLLAEDERSLSKALVVILQKSNYAVDAVYDGQQALDYLEDEVYDGVILDIMMPKVDGLKVLATIRQAGNDVPVLLLTAKSEVDDKVKGLDLGANDYLTKPFDAKELLARIRAMTRMHTQSPDSSLSFGNITLDRTTFELGGPNATMKLPNKEFQMLELLLANPKQVISTERMFEKIWGYDYVGDSVTVTVHINRIREKIEEDSKNPKIIETVWGAGYRLNR